MHLTPACGHSSSDRDQCRQQRVQPQQPVSGEQDEAYDQHAGVETSDRT